MIGVYRHKREQITFRLGPWPWGGQSYNAAMRRLPYRMEELLDFLEEQLSNNHVYIRGAEFSLVNVSSNFSKQSYGHEPEVPNLKAFGPVTFTFSLRRNTKAYHVRTSHKLSQYTTVWGSEGPWDFITITVPLSMAVRVKLNNSLMLHLENLYKVVGAFTKSVALNLKRSLDNTVAETLTYRNIPAVMRRFPRHFWPYSIDMWKYPYLMKIPHDEDFVLYYVKNLAGKVRMEGVKEFKAYADNVLNQAIVSEMQRQSQRFENSAERTFQSPLERWLLQSKHDFTGPTIPDQIIKTIHRGKWV